MAEEARQELEDQLRQTIETLVEISLLVHDTSGSKENKEGLIEQMDVLVKEFQRLKEIKCEKQIPIDVIDYIDQGRNPDVYTREFVELLLKQNQFISGKMDTYTNFQKILAQNVKETYPEMATAVDDVLQRTSPV